VKGLEFDRVILASINEGLVPLATAVKDKGDPVEARQADLEERSLLYVAVTRAKKEAYVLSYGKESPYFIGLA
jgi:superfamily I DNA/RNA helicase